MQKAVVDIGFEVKKKKKRAIDNSLIEAVYEMIDKRAITPVRW